MDLEILLQLRYSQINIINKLIMVNNLSNHILNNNHLLKDYSSSILKELHKIKWIILKDILIPTKWYLPKDTHNKWCLPKSIQINMRAKTFRQTKWFMLTLIMVIIIEGMKVQEVVVAVTVVENIKSIKKIKNIKNQVVVAAVESNFLFNCL